jgi:hypothetical protein
MVLAVLGADTLLGGAPAAARLAAEIGTGAVTYAAVLFTVHRARVRAFREMLRPALG